MNAFCVELSAVGGFNPTAQHPANFIDNFFDEGVFFNVKRFYIFHEPDKNAQDVELYASSLKDRQLLKLLLVAGHQNAF